jgi:tetratricopeptide (TPR) repeat protein
MKFSCLIISAVLFLSLSLFSQDASQFIAMGDSAFAKFNNEAALKYYSEALAADSNNYEAAWKLSRAYVDVGEDLKGKKERNEYFQNSEKYARKAIALDSLGSKGHLYLSIALGRVALDAGKKEQVRLSKEVKAEVDKALKLDPNDDIAWHVLGRWNRKMATLGWIQRKFADIFLGGVPKDASLENAVKDFKKAIELNPGYIHHHLELGITYKDMGDKEKAKKQFEEVLSLPKSSADDDRYKEEAKEYLNKLK